MSLAKKLLKSSTSDVASLLESSIFLKERDMITTPVPMLNVALSGDVNGGLTSGVTVLAGPSKNFKSGFALLFAGAYLNKYEDSALLFYDTEFGMPMNYFEMFSIPQDRVVHTPISDVEQLKHDVVTQLKTLERGDKVVIVIDSVGNLASVKEIEDAESGKQVADMTRAKSLKSFFRMVTPLAAMKDIPVIVINHTYMEIGLYPKAIVSGGTGVYYSADTIWILGRQQEKEGTDVTGYNFIINVEKSRFVKEKSKLPISVSFDKGIQKWAGMFDVAVDLGYIDSPAKGWYNTSDKCGFGLDRSAQKFRRSQAEYDNVFWYRMLEKTDIIQRIKDKYMLSTTDILNSPENEGKENEETE